MSRPVVVRAPFLMPEPVRPKVLPRRLHAGVDRSLEGLTSEQAFQYKLRAKKDCHAVCAAYASVTGRSQREFAEEWFGDDKRESTIRGWKDYEDMKRYPWPEDLRKAWSIVEKHRAQRGGEACK